MPGQNEAWASLRAWSSARGNDAAATAERVLVDLIEAGLQSKEAEKERFLSLVKRLTESRDAAERKRLKEELARMTFGD